MTASLPRAQTASSGGVLPRGDGGRDVHGLHVITDSIEVAGAAVRGGAAVVQVRAKGGSDRERFALAAAAVELCGGSGTLCLVNDRVDLALAAGADGVHLGADDLPLAAARRLANHRGADAHADGDLLTGRGFVIGGTARDPDQARQLVADGADYLGVGPVWATTSKDELPDLIGLDGLRSVAVAVNVPVIAISGVTSARIPETIAAGAAGVAVIAAVGHAPDPEAATRDLVGALHRARPS